MDQEQQTPNREAGPGGDGRPVENSKSSADSSTQNTLEIAEIRDNLVIMKDGSFRIVIKARSINFSLMSYQEQEAIEYSYQAFLNSLWFPIQIYVKSRRVDVNAYVHKLENLLKQQKNMLLSVLMDEYIDFISYLIDNSDIMNKSFYVIVPYEPSSIIYSKEKLSQKTRKTLTKFLNFQKKPSTISIDRNDLANAKNELRYCAQTVFDGLRNCGVETSLLNTKELIEFYYAAYKPDVALTDQPVNFEEVSTPMVQKQSNRQESD